MGGLTRIFFEWQKWLSLYSEFQRAKINGVWKILLENFFLYLLGHLREKNQRFEKHFSQIQNFRGVKFNRFQKIFPFTYYRSWQGAFWLIFEKIFSVAFFHGVKIENAKHRRNIFGHKKCALDFLKNESAGLLRYSVVGGGRSCRLFKLEIISEHFSVSLDFIRVYEYNI